MCMSKGVNMEPLKLEKIMECISTIQKVKIIYPNGSTCAPTYKKLMLDRDMYVSEIWCTQDILYIKVSEELNEWE